MSTSRVWGTAGGRQCHQIRQTHAIHTAHTLCVCMCVSMCVCKCSCVHVVRGHFSCEVPLLNITSLQFGCLPVNLLTHQNSNRELLLGPEGRRGKEGMGVWAEERR